ncbi:MAG: hypothetical protein LBR78_01455 [Holosporales bacterium]|jgi:hypothetical protein|nr:hypothetical protein [Holosporales bacterium]
MKYKIAGSVIAALLAVIETTTAIASAPEEKGATQDSQEAAVPKPSGQGESADTPIIRTISGKEILEAFPIVAILNAASDDVTSTARGKVYSFAITQRLIQHNPHTQVECQVAVVDAITSCVSETGANTTERELVHAMVTSAVGRAQSVLKKLHMAVELTGMVAQLELPPPLAPARPVKGQQPQPVVPVQKPALPVLHASVWLNEVTGELGVVDSMTPPLHEFAQSVESFAQTALELEKNSVKQPPARKGTPPPTPVTSPRAAAVEALLKKAGELKQLTS